MTLGLASYAGKPLTTGKVEIHFVLLMQGPCSKGHLKFISARINNRIMKLKPDKGSYDPDNTKTEIFDHESGEWQTHLDYPFHQNGLV